MVKVLVTVADIGRRPWKNGGGWTKSAAWEKAARKFIIGEGGREGGGKAARRRLGHEARDRRLGTGQLPGIGHGPECFRASKRRL